MRHSRQATFSAFLILALAWTALGVPVAWGLAGKRLPVLSGLKAGSDAGSRLAPGKGRSPYSHLEGELNALEVALFADAADGFWDVHTLLEAALIASGVGNRKALEQYGLRVDRLAEELARSGTVGGSPRDRAQAVFEFLHRRVLHGGYALECTNLTILLDDGRYNCVSATVLFNCLADRFGLPACALQVPGHAMSRLKLPRETLDVETTCSVWFRLMDSPEKQAELIRRAIASSSSASQSPGKPREVSGVEVVGAIYYNRGVDLLGEARFQDAVAANAKALRLTPASTTARENLLATMNNWAIELDTAGRHADAIDRLREGIALDATYPTFRANYIHIHSRWIGELCQAGDFEAALGVIGRAAEDEFDEPFVRSVQVDLLRRRPREGSR